MSQLSSDLLLRAQRRLGNDRFLREVRSTIIANQQKLSRQIYNADSRNMKKFTQEWADFQKKFKLTKQSGFASRSLPIKRASKYEENQLLELSFEDRFKSKQQGKGINEQISALTIRNSSVEGSSNRNVTFKNSLNSRYSFRVNYVECRKAALQGLGARQKSNSFVKAEKHALRKRVITQWDHSPNNQSVSRLSAQKNHQPSNQPFQYHTDDYIIDITREKMDRYIRNLHRLEWAFSFLKQRKGPKLEESREYREHMRNFEFDADTPINELAINYMISRRYQLHSTYLEDIYQQKNRSLNEEATSFGRKKLADSQQYPILSALSSHSILHLLQKNVNQSNFNSIKGTSNVQSQQAIHQSNQINFSLPYSEFISYKETKNSIYQLIGMNPKLALKLAFTIFDKNRNGVIDEDDLLQLISLSRHLPTLEVDIVTLSRGMLTLKHSRKPFFQKPRLTKGQVEWRREGRERSVTYMRKESEDRSHILPIEEEKGSDSEESESQQKSLSTSRFSLDKLYIFLKKREKNNKESGPKLNDKVQSLNFPMFCKAFQFKRPYLVYDLFQYLFDASITDFKEPIQQQISIHLSKLHPNNQTTQYPQQEETLQQKWNNRLKFSNSILKTFIQRTSQQQFH